MQLIQHLMSSSVLGKLQKAIFSCKSSGMGWGKLSTTANGMLAATAFAAISIREPMLPVRVNTWTYRRGDHRWKHRCKPENRVGHYALLVSDYATSSLYTKRGWQAIFIEKFKSQFDLRFFAIMSKHLDSHTVEPEHSKRSPRSQNSPTTQPTQAGSPAYIHVQYYTTYN